MEIRTIGYFLAVVEAGSLTAAAKRLDLTQPALTKAIPRLEDEAGSALFMRGSSSRIMRPRTIGPSYPSPWLPPSNNTVGPCRS